MNQGLFAFGFRLVSKYSSTRLGSTRLVCFVLGTPNSVGREAWEGFLHFRLKKGIHKLRVQVQLRVTYDDELVW